ncbi:MAG: 2-hydroxychromene-2-carboxylate isomerase [Alphaproteobacteria bacterium]|nr:MAG: 2-hydroxychromene-2-carboxylate isomerase [Alphaproteobacteria bacterium]
MAAPIEFYFDFSSPYGYLAAQRIDEVAAEHGRTVAWKPFLLGVAFKTTGQSPLLDIPIKGDYARRDLARSARLFDIPFTLPKPFPFMSVAACRAVYWLEERDPEAARDLCKALYSAAFGDGRSIAEPGQVAAVAAGLGHDEGDVLAAVQNPRVKDRLRSEVDAAIKKGVFGSPFFIVDGEPFWGYDRLEDLGLWLDSGGW